MARVTNNKGPLAAPVTSAAPGKYKRSYIVILVKVQGSRNQRCTILGSDQVGVVMHCDISIGGRRYWAHRSKAKAMVLCLQKGIEVIRNAICNYCLGTSHDFSYAGDYPGVLDLRAQCCPLGEIKRVSCYMDLDYIHINI